MQEHQRTIVIPRTDDPAGTAMHPLGQGFLGLPSATVTGLRGFQSSRGGLQIPGTSLYRFVRQYLEQQTWGSTQDFSIQSAFAGSTAGGHGANGQPLGDQEAHIPDEMGGGLVQKVPSLVGNPLVQGRH